MRKFLPFAAICALLSLIAMNDYGVCSGASSMKAACSACHQGSISGDVFITDGKAEGDSVIIGDVQYNVVLRLPVGDYASVQLNTVTDIEIPMEVELDMATEIQVLRNNSLYSLASIRQKSNGDNEFENIHLKFTLDEPLTERQQIIVQGVLADGDGTVEGDIAFYKELSLEPTKNDITASNLTIISDGISYYPHHDVLEAVCIDKTTQLRIVDMQGKVVVQQFVENYAAVDLSLLEKGYYIAVLGSTGKDMTTYKFIR